MCGIAGYICRQSYSDALGSMTSALQHRGPDGHGHYSITKGDWHIGLGHRRLAIIDVSGGAQPIVDAQSGDAITYNGEVYNFALLRQHLASRGCSFQTRCDTEVVFRQLQTHGAGGVREMDGMFAFAFWNSRDRTLLLARDPAGIKPLFYCSSADGGIIFASELLALARHPLCPRRIDPDALAWYFSLDYVPAPGAILAGVCKLPPGHSLLWHADGRLQVERYWMPPVAVSNTARDVTAQVRQTLEDAVKQQMVSDVPIGVFLSGGIDSSTVAALAAKASDRPIQTFSIGFEDADYDESQYAQAVATHIGSDHTSCRLSEGMMLDCLPQALQCLDEPVADPSVIPTWLVSKLAREKVKVCLGGDGGDELFGGYPTLKAHRWAPALATIPSWIRDRVLRSVIASLPQSDRRHNLAWKARRFVERFDADPFRRHLRWMSSVDPNQVGQLFDRLIAIPDLDAIAPSQSSDLLSDIMRLDFCTYLPGSVLAKVDRASMFHSLEVRPPLLHRSVMELALSLPSNLKYRRGTGKVLLKQAVHDLLPAHIVHRQKRGFGIPLQKWIREPLRDQVREILRHSPVWEQTPLRRSHFSELVEQHQQRQADNAKVIWSLVVLDGWLRRLNSVQ